MASSRQFSGLQPCCEMDSDSTCFCLQQSNSSGVKLGHIQLACACMLLVFLLGLGMRARILHNWASYSSTDDRERSSGERLLSLIGLVSRMQHATDHALRSSTEELHCMPGFCIGV